MSNHGRVIGLRHVGYFVEDMDVSLDMFKRLFDVGDDDIRLMTAEETGGTGVFGFVSIGGVELELIQLISDDIKKITGDTSPGINHVAFQVENIEAVVTAMEKKGFRLGYITKNGIFDTGKTKVAYLEPLDTDGHLIELVEVKAEGADA
jgi:catechol 2,3-dioxygenase-like lactoylglutathione lyase family enzyme